MEQTLAQAQRSPRRKMKRKKRSIKRKVRQKTPKVHKRGRDLLHLKAAVRQERPPLPHPKRLATSLLGSSGHK